jgi:hypothetical protein
MALIRKKPGHQESGDPVEEDTDTPGHVEVTIHGPDAERLEGLVDMAAIAARLKKRATPSQQPEPEN